MQSGVMCREREDLRRGRKVLIDLIERNGIPVFSDMANTLACSVLNIAQVHAACWVFEYSVNRSSLFRCMRYCRVPQCSRF